MIVRVPSNRSITPMAQESSARIASFRDSGFRLLAGGDASTQTPLTENSSTRLRTISFHRGLGESSVRRGVASGLLPHGICPAD